MLYFVHFVKFIFQEPVVCDNDLDLATSSSMSSESIDFNNCAFNYTTCAYEGSWLTAVRLNMLYKNEGFRLCTILSTYTELMCPVAS